MHPEYWRDTAANLSEHFWRMPRLPTKCGRGRSGHHGLMEAKHGKARALHPGIN